jgi:hypothetical protein
MSKNRAAECVSIVGGLLTPSGFSRRNFWVETVRKMRGEAKGPAEIAAGHCQGVA